MLAMPWIATGVFVYQSFISDSKMWNIYTIPKAFMFYSLASIITLFFSGFLVDKFSSRKLIPIMNFPILVVHSSLKPTYFGKDLFIDSGRLPYLDLTLKEKKEFLINIKWLLIFLYSLLSAALSDYWLFKTQNSTSYFEILGVTGGILKIFQMIASIGGGFFLSKTRKRALKRSRKNSADDSSLELIEINLKQKQEDNSIDDQ